MADPLTYSGCDIYNAIRAAVLPERTVAALRWRVPAVVLRMGGVAGDIAAGLLRRPLPLNSEVVSRLLDSACYVPERIASELGWRAQIDLGAGVREMLA